MSRAWLFSFYLALLLLFAMGGCVSVPPAGRSAGADLEDAEQTGADGQKEAPPISNEDTQTIQRMREFLDTGLRKLDQGSISEGIAQLVNVLAEASSSKSAANVETLRRKAETELFKVRAGLAMEAGLEWLDENKNQLSASSVDVGADKALQPSVILTLNYGGAGKALVTGAPIVFEFINGSGLLTAVVNTNDYGQANCAVARLDNPNSETVIRASLIYRVRGFSYSFEGISKDFVFIPPARKATILVMEKAGGLIAEDPIILDAVYNKLKGVTFDFSQYNGKLLGEDFLKAFGGEPKAIRKMGLEKEVSYLVMVLNDGYNVSQVELAGKKYNIFKSQTNATTRLIRVADGKIMYSGSVQAVQGQGGTQEKAVLDGFRNAAAAMADKLQQELAEIKRVLAGKAE
jgi:hypothetical protein